MTRNAWGRHVIRLDPLLENRQVRHIVGQRETTLEIPKIIEERRIVLVKLSARLPRQAKAFIGTMLVSELLAAARKPKRMKSHFCIFIDEFQHVAAVGATDAAANRVFFHEPHSTALNSASWSRTAGRSRITTV